MEAEQMFKVAIAAIALAEKVEEWFEEPSGSCYDPCDSEGYHEMYAAFEEYQHARDRG